jgi:hypothetical protein
MHGLNDAQGLSSWIKIKNPAYTHIAGREEYSKGKGGMALTQAVKAASERKPAVGGLNWVGS